MMKESMGHRHARTHLFTSVCTAQPCMELRGDTDLWDCARENVLHIERAGAVAWTHRLWDLDQSPSHYTVHNSFSSAYGKRHHRWWCLVDCVCSLICSRWTECIFLYNRIYPNATRKAIQGGTVPSVLELPVPGVTVCLQVPAVPETFREEQLWILRSVGPHIHTASAYHGEGLPDALMSRHKLNCKM